MRVQTQCVDGCAALKHTDDFCYVIFQNNFENITLLPLLTGTRNPASLSSSTQEIIWKKKRNQKHNFSLICDHFNNYSQTLAFEYLHHLEPPVFNFDLQHPNTSKGNVGVTHCETSAQTAVLNERQNFPELPKMPVPIRLRILKTFD